MGLFGFFKTAAPAAADFENIVRFYKQIRSTRLRLNGELTSRLSKDVLNEGAKKLGMLRGGMFVFENENETSVLMDYCIHDVYRRGRNAVEQYLCDSPPDPDSVDMTCLRAMQHATYSMVAVLRVEPGVGCHIENLFTDERRLLVDIGFSRSVQPGTVIATRLFDFGEFLATSGAALPVGVLDERSMAEWRRKLLTGVGVEHADPAPLIRGCLRHGSSSMIHYEGGDAERRPLAHAGNAPRLAETAAQRQAALAKRRTGKSALNRRCACGSGKMFKNCCGKRAGRPPS